MLNKFYYLRFAAYSSFTFFLLSLRLVLAQAPNIPDPGVMGRSLVANVLGTYTAPPKRLVADEVTDAAVTGNGDMAITVGGDSSALKFYVGKADFWGVLRGEIMPVGSLVLSTPALRDSSYLLNEKVGLATITGSFMNGEHGLSVTSWVATAVNTAVIQLKNTGSQPLSLTSQLLDGFASSTGNPATFGSAKNSTWLNVSPDTVNLELGNEMYNKLGTAPFSGKIADMRFYNKALSGAMLAALDNGEAPPPLLCWTATNTGSAKMVGNARLNAADSHGGSVSLTGDVGAEVLVGDLPLPENQFTVSAWINPAITGGNGCIVAAQIPYLQTYGTTFPYPYVRGLTLKLVNGALSATLNQSGTLNPSTMLFATDSMNKFATTAGSVLPTNEWVQVAAAYDGNMLTIYTNGIKAGATTEMPTGLPDGMMGWNKMVTHLGDTNVIYNGCAPQGVLMQSVHGVATTTNGQGALSFTLPAGGQATIVLAAVTDRNSANYFTAAQQQTQAATPASLINLQQVHDQWWNNFWSKSFVQIPDQKIQDSWYASLYLLACCSRSNSPAPGLWGNFNTSAKPAWSGDYTMDYNYEAPFWAALANNHMELADNYDQPLLDQISRGRATAQRIYGTNDGIYFYCHFIPAPGWSDDPGTFWGQKSLALFPAVNCAMRWRLTHDKDYAAKIYPFLKGVADFWDSYLVLENDHYVDYHDSAWENSGDDTNPSTTIAFIQLLYPSLVEMSQVLNVDADRRAKWNDIIARLTPLSIVPASSISSLNALGAPYNAPGVNVIRCSSAGTAFPAPAVTLYQDHVIRNSSAGMSSCQVIFPGWNVGLESDPVTRLAASNTIWLAAQWFDFNNECSFYPGAACAGYAPGAILSNLNAFLTRCRNPNFTIDVGGGGTEHYAIVPATLAAMFVQSYQTNIHVFPDWPADQSAAFGNLNACGGFLVSSAITLGRPNYVQIQSTAGRMLQLANPWPGEKIRCLSSVNGKLLLSGAVFTYQTQPGEVLTLTAPPLAPLSVPRNLRAHQNKHAVLLNWSAVPHAAGYNLKRATSSAGPYLTVAAVTDVTSYTDSSAAYETTYYYAVSALEPGFESPDSARVMVTTPLAPPVPLPTIFKQHLNIGAANAGTYTETDADAVTMSTDSGDIWDVGDSFEFAWKKMDGDCTITCRVTSLNNGVEWSKAGVMIRETTEGGARNAALVLTSGHGVTYQNRPTTGGVTGYQLDGGQAAPYWLKLARRGKLFYASTSADGLTWKAATGSPQTIEMDSSVSVGLVVSAHGGPVVSAGFDHISVTGNGN